MAKVPQAKLPNRALAVTGARFAYESPNGGQAIAQGLENLSAGFASLAKQEQQARENEAKARENEAKARENEAKARERAAKARAQEALLQYEEQYQSLLYSPDEGYMYKSGKDAVEARDQVVQQLGQLRKQFETQLEDPVARQLFSSKAREQELRVKQGVWEFADKNAKVYQAEVLDSERKNVVTNAQLYYDNDNALREQELRGILSIQDKYETLGKDDPRVIRAEVDSFRDKMYTGAIQAAIGANNLSRARELFKRAQKLLSPTTQISLRKQLAEKVKVNKEQVILGTAQAIVDQVYQPGVPLPDLLKEIRAKATDPKVRAKAESLARAYHSDERQARNEARADNYLSAQQLLRQGKSFDEIPPELKSNLSNDQIEQLKKGPPTGADDKTMLNALNAMPPRVVAKMDLNDFIVGSDVSPEALTKMRELQRKAKEGAPGETYKATDAVIEFAKKSRPDLFTPKVSAVSRSLTLKQKQEASRREVNLRLVLTPLVQSALDEKAAKGDPPVLSPDEMNDLVGKAVITAYDKDGEPLASVLDIPAKDRADLTHAYMLNHNGQPPDDATLVRLYVKLQQKRGE